MNKHLPARPNLDHLRRQAKALLASLGDHDPQAVAILQEHLPEAKGLTAAQVLAANYRLADAQSAVARKNGFASWPHLARHVEQLRAMEGTWAFEKLEIDGSAMPAEACAGSQLLIDGDRFRTESPGAIYEGVFNINVEAQPHEIDIEFVEGPEAGNWNYGIFRIEGDTIEFCLDMRGQPRPREFRTLPSSGTAYEKLKRISHARPSEVSGGTLQAPPAAQPAQNGEGFEHIDSPTLAKLAGKWVPVKIVRDGQNLPSMILHTGSRVAEKNEIKITIAGQLMVHALVRIDEKSNPLQVDYYNIGGPLKGAVQLGIMQWVGTEACFCMAAPGQPRPADFTCAPGSGRTLSQWRLKK